MLFVQLVGVLFIFFLVFALLRIAREAGAVLPPQRERSVRRQLSTSRRDVETP